MTWIRTVPLSEGDEKLRRAVEAQKAMYPKEYATPVHPTADGTSGIVEILDHVERRTDLDVIAITDHERIDAAVAAHAMAADHGLRFEVVVGEEITTRGGHLLAGMVRPTLEVVLTEVPATLRRKKRADLGIALIDLAAARG